MIKGRIALSIFLVIMAALPFCVADVSYAAQPPEKIILEKATRMLDQVSRDKKKRKLRSSWERCIAEFDKVIRKYPSSSYAGDAVYFKAQAFEGMYNVSRVRADQDEAIVAYQYLVESYPENGHMDDALYRTASIYMERGDNQLAAGYFQLLTTKYPKSPHAKDALSKLKSLPKPRATPATDSIPVALPGSPPANAAASGTAPSARPGLAVVKSLRYWSGKDSTRLVLDVDGDVTYETSQLKNPDRVFFDIKKAALTEALIQSPLTINDGVIKTVRASQYDEETVRVVLDLDRSSGQKTFMIAGPTRLVIDVSCAAGSSAVQEKIAAVGPSAAEPRKPSGNGRYITVNNTSTPVQPPTVSKPLPAPATVKTPAAPPPLHASSGLDIIVIDPGHGGHDSGAVGKGGLQEKDVVLDVGKRLRDLIERELGCKVIMTRDTDVFVDLDQRPRLASQRGATLFISIHANASKNRKASGIETYLLNTTKDRYIMEVAAKENMMTMDKMGALDIILADLVLLTKRPESLKLAHAVQANLVSGLKKPSRTVNDKGVKQGPFLVLYGADMPSILTEVGFISNPEEEKLLGSAAYRQEVAESILEGIREYVKDSDVITAYR